MTRFVQVQKPGFLVFEFLVDMHACVFRVIVTGRIVTSELWFKCTDVGNGSKFFMGLFVGHLFYFWLQATGISLFQGGGIVFEINSLVQGAGIVFMILWIA